MVEDHHHRFDEVDLHHLPRQSITIPELDCQGWILDIGGGGEGIMGLVKGRQVVAIDISREELEEIENDSLRIVMDATDLRFLDDTFDLVTAFYTFMYMTDGMIRQALEEIVRVLVPGGELLIWEPVVDPSVIDRDVFVTMLDVHLPDGGMVETGYGSRVRRMAPDIMIGELDEVGLALIEGDRMEHGYFLRARKD
jgi:ubiquinone/menaquinone biosynthesis C-methylase UbiE